MTCYIWRQNNTRPEKPCQGQLMCKDKMKLVISQPCKYQWHLSVVAVDVTNPCHRATNLFKALPALDSTRVCFSPSFRIRPLIAPTILSVHTSDCNRTILKILFLLYGQFRFFKKLFSNLEFCSILTESDVIIEWNRNMYPTFHLLFLTCLYIYILYL